MLGAFAQRPIFIASLATFFSLRTARAAISDEYLRLLPVYFARIDDLFALDPSFEPSSDIPSAENTRKFAIVQQMRDAGLVVAVDAPHLYGAAMSSKSCRLTALGRRYWKQARDGRV